jgi:hypothetical protein
MSNEDTSRSESGSLPAEGVSAWLPDVLPKNADPPLSELLAKPRVRLEALSFADGDPLEGVDATATSIRFGRPGAAPGPARTPFMLRTISASVYGHTPPFMQVHSEAAPAPEGADETATDPEWDASVRP